MLSPSENISAMVGGNIPQALSNLQTSTIENVSQIYCWTSTTVEITYKGSPETTFTGSMVDGQMYFNPNIKTVKNVGLGVVQVS